METNPSLNLVGSLETNPSLNLVGSLETNPSLNLIEMIKIYPWQFLKCRLRNIINFVTNWFYNPTSPSDTIYRHSLDQYLFQ